MCQKVHIWYMCIATVNLNKRFLFGEEECVRNHAPVAFQEKYVFNKGTFLLFGKNILIILSSCTL